MHACDAVLVSVCLAACGPHKGAAANLGWLVHQPAILCVPDAGAVIVSHPMPVQTGECAEFQSYILQAYHYLSSIAVKEGKVFALFVRSPSKVRQLGGGLRRQCHSLHTAHREVDATHSL